jgi:hypothetical protein
LAFILGESDSRRRSEQKRRRILMLVLVVVAFAVCWLPINFYHLLVDSGVINTDYHLFISVKIITFSVYLRKFQLNLTFFISKLLQFSKDLFESLLNYEKVKKEYFIRKPYQSTKQSIITQ